MKRILFALAFGTSLLLFIASLSMWVRSYRGGEGWIFASRQIDPPPETTGSFLGLNADWYCRRTAASTDGSIEWVEMEYCQLRGLTPLGLGRFSSGYRPGARIYRIPTSSLDSPVARIRHWSLPGIDYVAAPTKLIKGGLRSGETSLIVRWWLIASLTALPPLVFTTRLWKLHRSARRRIANLCSSCGYDLRASKDRCTECGTPISAAMTSPGHGTDQT